MPFSETQTSYYQRGGSSGFETYFIRTANALFVRSPQRPIYFGRIVGSPPWLPGGGMIGILPVSGVGARISGSTPVGGQSTPSDLASLSLSGSARGSVVVVPCGAMVPCCGIDCVGAQPVAFLAGAGGAV
jgi:hypothetical protein